MMIIIHDGSPYGTPSPNLAGWATIALRSFFSFGATPAVTGVGAGEGKGAAFFGAAAAAAGAAEPPANSPIYNWAPYLCNTYIQPLAR